MQPVGDLYLIVYLRNCGHLSEISVYGKGKAEQNKRKLRLPISHSLHYVEYILQNLRATNSVNVFRSR